MNEKESEKQKKLNKEYTDRVLLAQRKKERKNEWMNGWSE